MFCGGTEPLFEIAFIINGGVVIDAIDCHLPWTSLAL